MPSGLALELALQTNARIGDCTILALVAALVDRRYWGSHRTCSCRGNRLIGVRRVTGGIDAWLLPSPRLTPHDIQIGDGMKRSALVRSASNSRSAHSCVVNGAPLSQHLLGHRFVFGFIRRLQARICDDCRRIVDRPDSASKTARLCWPTRPAAQIHARTAWFDGEARSLVGPVKGEGGHVAVRFTPPARLSRHEAGTLKLHLNVDPTDYPPMAPWRLRQHARSDGTLGQRPLALACAARPAPAMSPSRARRREDQSNGAVGADAGRRPSTAQKSRVPAGGVSLRARGHGSTDLVRRQIDVYLAVSGGGKQMPAAAVACCAGTVHIAAGAAGIGIDQVTRRQRLAESARRYHQQSKW
jgi:hypothetical protein